MPSTLVENTRKRRKQQNNDAPSKEKEPVEPLDEQEQEKVVQSLMDEANEQIELIHNIFSRICEAAILLCLIVGATSADPWSWLHVVGASFLHWGAIQVAATAKPQKDERSIIRKIAPLAVVVVVAGAFLYPNSSRPKRAKRHIDHDVSHFMGLAMSNVVTMIGALYLKWDSKSTKKALEDLEKSKYHFKSL